MGLDITALAIRVTSEGIQQATKSLNDLAAASAKVEQVSKTTKSASDGLSASQAKGAASVEALLAKMQKQVDLLGANTSQTNSYNMAMKNSSDIKQQMAAMLGAEVDAYKRLSASQSEAARMNKSLDASYAKLSKEADKYYADQAKNSAAGKALNDLGYRQQQFQKLSATQAEAIAMNKAFDASIQRQKSIMQSRDIETHAAGVKRYAAAQAEAIAMNNAMDAAARKSTVALGGQTKGMKDAHDVARGLSGSLGALWITYGNFAAMGLGIAIGASLKGVLTIGKDVEHTLESLRVKGGETVESANNMREAIYSIGQGVYGPQEIAKALEVLVLAGLNATQAMAALRPALNLATAGGTDIKTAAEGLVTIGTAVGATADSYTMLADGITTAANISLASVESITNTVKRASVVNKLYGASFEDILIQASALANLGIKDTAAGTAITNFYSDMQGKSEKAKKALAELSMEFSDSTGRAKPLVGMIKELNTSLNNFTPEKQKTLIMDIFGERSKRDVVAITSMIRSASDEAGKYGSKLEEIAAKISEMAGASTLAAVQIALTTENQIKSMSNTLKVTLARTFTELEPQVNVFTAKMKEAFNSPQFAAALVTIASSVASVTVGLVNNIGPLSLFVAGIVALKLATSGMALATMLTGPLMATATAFGSTTVAAGGATVATGLFGTAIRALPFIGLAAGIAAVIGALIMYKFHMAGAKNTAIQTAEAYRSNYLGALKDEADQIKRTTDNLAAGMPLMEAQTRGIKEQALAKARLNNQNAIGAAQADLDSAKKGFNDSYGPEYLRMAEKNGKLPPVIVALTKELQNQKDASKRFEEQALKSTTSIVNGSEIIRQSYVKEQEAAQAAADAAAGRNAGAPPEDKHGDRVRLKTQFAIIDAEIEAGRKLADADKIKAQSEYRQGLIGELSLIDRKRDAEVASQTSIIDGEIKKARVLEATHNKDNIPAYVEAEAKIQAAIKATADAAQVASDSRAEYLVRLTDLNNKSDAKMYESNGQYAAAYDSLFKSKHDVEIGRLQEMYNTSKDLSEKTAIMKRKEVLESEYAAGTQAAQNKEAVYNFNVLAESTSNALRGIQTATEGLGISEMFNAASAASATLAANMDALREKQSAITGDKEANEAEARMIRLAETQRKLWSGVGESISKSLGDAFGNAGKAAGDMLMVAVNAGQTEERLAANKAKAFKDIEELQGAGIDRTKLAGKVAIEYTAKERSASLKTYGDMAGAAKGFFKEGSTGYKVLHGLEQAMHVMQMANMAEKLFTSLFVTTTTTAAGVAANATDVASTVTTEAAKNTAKVPGVFMSFMSWLGPWGMAAAGAAIAAVLGSSFGGGGGGISGAREDQKKRIETQGTGTLLGDSSAKSDSIQKSLDLIAEYAFQDLEYSNKMLTAMQSIASALTGVSKGLALTQGLMSGTNFGTLEGSTAGFGASVPVVGKLLSSIFGGGTTSTITGSGIKLDGTVGQLADKQGSFQQYEEIAKKKSGGWFSKDKNWTVTNTKPLEDDIVSSFARTFGAVREGLLDVGSGIGLSADALAAQINAIPIKMTAELRGLKGKELEEAVTAIFSAQIDNIAAQALSVVVPFAKMGEGLFETAVRIGNTFRVIDLELQSIGTTFGAVGTGSMAARMGLVEMMGGLEEFVSKTDFFKENFLTEAEQLAPISKAVSAEMARLEHSSVTTIEAFKKLVLQQDLSTLAGQEMYTALMNVAPAFKKVADAAKEMLSANVDSAMEVLQASVSREKDAAQAAYDAQIAIINAQKSSAEEVFNTTKDALTETMNAATASNTAFKALASSLKSTLDGMFLVTQQAMRRQSAQEMITAALQVARNTGVLPTTESLSEALKTVAQPSENLFATFEDYATDFGVTAGQIADLNDITNEQVKKSDTAVDLAKMQLNMLETNHKSAMMLLTNAEAAAKSFYDSEVTRLDGILVSAQAQVDAVNGTTVAVVSVKDAIASLTAAVLALASNQPAKTGTMTAAQRAALTAEGTAAAIAHQTGAGNVSAVSTPVTANDTKAIESLYQEYFGHASDPSGLAYWEQGVRNGASMDNIRESFANIQADLINGSHAGGLDEVPFDGYTAKLHRGEMVLPASSAKAVREDATNKEILDALNKLCEENSAENQSMASNLTTLRKLFERLSPDGQSIQTTPVAA